MFMLSNVNRQIWKHLKCARLLLGMERTFCIFLSNLRHKTVSLSFPDWNQFRKLTLSQLIELIQAL